MTPFSLSLSLYISQVSRIFTIVSATTIETVNFTNNKNAGNYRQSSGVYLICCCIGFEHPFLCFVHFVRWTQKTQWPFGRLPFIQYYYFFLMLFDVIFLSIAQTHTNTQCDQRKFDNIYVFFVVVFFSVVHFVWPSHIETYEEIWNNKMFYISLIGSLLIVSIFRKTIIQLVVTYDYNRHCGRSSASVHNVRYPKTETFVHCVYYIHRQQHILQYPQSKSSIRRCQSICFYDCH